MGMELLVVGPGRLLGLARSNREGGKRQRSKGRRGLALSPIFTIAMGEKCTSCWTQIFSINSKVQQAQRALVYELLRRNCEVLILHPAPFTRSQRAG